MGKFHLRACRGRLCAAGEDVENEACAVEHFDVERVLDVRHLFCRKVVVEYGEVNVVFLHIFGYFLKFAFSHESAWVGVIYFLEERFYGCGAGCVGEKR